MAAHCDNERAPDLPKSTQAIQQLAGGKRLTPYEWDVIDEQMRAAALKAAASFLRRKSR